MSKHTPGPWIAAPYSSKVGAPVVSDSGRSIASVTYYPMDQEIFKNHHEESAANGRLIAAAPDLLQALKELLELTDDPKNDADPEESVFAFARSVIAKAEGRS